LKLVTVIVAAFVFAAFSSTPAHPQKAQCRIAPDPPRVVDVEAAPQAGGAEGPGNTRCIEVLS
jgi:hypothetical protein